MSFGPTQLTEVAKLNMPKGNANPRNPKSLYFKSILNSFSNFAVKGKRYGAFYP